MALVVKDRVQETSTTTGTGTLTLDGAVSGFQTFSSAIGNTNTTYYTIVNGAEWEVGLGTVAAGTLARDTVLESSNGGTAVNFSAGTKNVFCTYPAEKAVIQDASGFVGIGTNTPSYNLEVYGSEPTARVYNTNAALASMIQIANPSNAMMIGKDRDGSSGWYGSAGEYVIAGNGNFPMNFWVNSGKRMTIAADGKVGIGTASPANALEVSSLETFEKLNSTQSGYSVFYQATNPQGSFYAGKDRDGSAGLFGSGGEYVIAGSGNYPMDFWTNTVKRMTITASGGLSFGSSGTAYGTSGQVLTSNGNAAPTWADAAGASAGGVIYENNTTISSNYTLTTSKNGFSVGDITIASGVTVTVPSGQKWVIL